MNVSVRRRWGGDVPWPTGWPPPRVGEVVTVGEDADTAEVCRVEHVEWDPARDTVYIVLEGTP